MAGTSIEAEGQRRDRQQPAPPADDRRAAQPRRVRAASAWIAQLQRQGGDGAKPFLARAPKGDAVLIEGTTRRSVKAGMLVPALARVVGPVRELAQADIDRYAEGPPVEVFEASTGPAFLVVGGRRLPIRGLPLPHLVTDEEASVFPLGEEVNVSLGAGGAAKVSTSPLRRVQHVVAEEGPVHAATTLARKAAARVRARLAPKQ